MTTAELLAAARQSHRNYINAKKAGQLVAARSHLAAAQLQRKEAHDADLEHADPAWLDDARNTYGQIMRDRQRSVAQIARDQHDQLLVFYQAALDPAPVRVRRPLTEREIRERITTPEGVAVEETEAYRRVCEEHGIKPREIPVKVREGRPFTPAPISDEFVPVDVREEEGRK